MPRCIKEIKVIAVNDGKNPVKYLTENAAIYENPDEFIRYVLAEPHRERYDIRYIAHNSYKSYMQWMPDTSEEEFSSMVRYMAKFSPYYSYDSSIYRKYFNDLWEGGLSSPC